MDGRLAGKGERGSKMKAKTGSDKPPVHAHVRVFCTIATRGARHGRTRVQLERANKTKKETEDAYDSSTSSITWRSVRRRFGWSSWRRHRRIFRRPRHARLAVARIVHRRDCWRRLQRPCHSQQASSTMRWGRRDHTASRFPGAGIAATSQRLSVSP